VVLAPVGLIVPLREGMRGISRRWPRICPLAVMKPDLGHVPALRSIDALTMGFAARSERIYALILGQRNSSRFCSCSISCHRPSGGKRSASKVSVQPPWKPI
jgi:hypothetical protein